MAVVFLCMLADNRRAAHKYTRAPKNVKWKNKPLCIYNTQHIML